MSGNINRILNSVAQYAYSENEDTLFMHLYCGADIDTEFSGKKVKIQVTSAYPWEENVQIAFEMEEAVPFTYAVRLPSWCPEAQVLVNGEKADGEEKDGYLYISRKWENGDRIECTFPMKATASPSMWRRLLPCVFLSRKEGAFSETDG